MKNFFRFFVALSVPLLLFSCQKEPEPIQIGKMTSFNILASNNPEIFYDIEFEIGENAITATIPEFMKSMEFIPTFTFEGKEMLVLGERQVSGETVQDFSRPLKYQIISRDGMITEYEVKINYPVPESAKITSFVFQKEQNINLEEDLQLTIDGMDISGTLPRRMNLEKLVPVFTYEGVSIQVDEVEQVSGESVQDFTRPVSYVVTNKEGLSATYTVQLTCPESNKLPVIRITTAGRVPIKDKVNEIPAEIMIEDPDCKYWDKPAFNTTMKIRGRGNSTWGKPKKPYRLKLDQAEALLGMPSDKDWALMANYCDKALLRNTIAFKLSEIVGMSWTPKSVPVEVWLNDDYLGCYDLTEHKEVAKGKVDINVAGLADTEGFALEGDYYLEIDQSMNAPTKWWTEKCRIPIQFKEPEYPQTQQIEYVKKYIQDTETALMGTDFIDPVKGYAAWIDVESFINAYIVQEVMKNIDGNMRKSSYMTKERGQKLKMYHVWDFDITLGNCDYMNREFRASNGPEGWFIQTCSLNEVNNPQNQSTNWYTRLFMDPGFKQKVKEKWNAIKPQLDEIPAFIDNKVEDLVGPAGRNFQRWDILARDMWPNLVVPGSYMGEIYYMEEFYTRRIAWMDAEINKW